MRLQNIAKKVFGTQNERELKRLRPIVAEVNAFEPAIKALSDEQLRGKTAEFKQRVANGETLDELLPEAFAVVREAGRRMLRHKRSPMISAFSRYAICRAQCNDDAPAMSVCSTCRGCTAEPSEKR